MTDERRREFGRKVVAMMGATGWSRRRLAQELNMGRDTLRLIENGSGGSLQSRRRVVQFLCGRGLATVDRMTMQRAVSVAVDHHLERGA